MLLLDRGLALRIGIFIDGSNFIRAQTLNGWNIDWKRVLEHFAKHGDVTEAHYFSAAPHYQETVRIEGYRRFTRMLAISGYTVHDKETKVRRNADGAEERKGNLDLELALCTFELSDNYDRCILFSGDGDFAILAEKLRQRGKQVHCVCRRQMTATELINAANRFADLETLRTAIEKQ